MADFDTADEYQGVSQEDFEDIYSAWKEAEMKASLVDSLEEEVRAKDKEISTLRARVQEPHDYQLRCAKKEAAKQKKIYEEKAKKDARKIQDLEKQVATLANVNVATTHIPANADTLDEVMEQLRQLQLENAALKGMRQKEGEYEDGTGKKRKRQDNAPK